MAVLVLGTAREPLSASRRLALLVDALPRRDAAGYVSRPVFSNVFISSLLAWVRMRAHHGLVLQVRPIVVDCSLIQNIDLARFRLILLGLRRALLMLVVRLMPKVACLAHLLLLHVRILLLCQVDFSAADGQVTSVDQRLPINGLQCLCLICALREADAIFDVCLIDTAHFICNCLIALIVEAACLKTQIRFKRILFQAVFATAFYLESWRGFLNDDVVGFLRRLMNAISLTLRKVGFSAAWPYRKLRDLIDVFLFQATLTLVIAFLAR